MARKKIVVVESKEELLSMECALLKKNGYEVFSAMDADSAKNYLEKHKIDLILLNVNMPAVDSYALCKNIKSSCAPGKIAVVLTSSGNDKLDLHVGEQAGVDGYLIVPFRVSILIDTIEEALSSVQEERRTLAVLPIMSINERS